MPPKPYYQDDAVIENDHIESLLDPENAMSSHGPWAREDTTGVWLTDDDGCALFVTADQVAALVNQAVRRRSPRG